MRSLRFFAIICQSLLWTLSSVVLASSPRKICRSTSTSTSPPFRIVSPSLSSFIPSHQRVGGSFYRRSLQCNDAIMRRNSLPLNPRRRTHHHELYLSSPSEHDPNDPDTIINNNGGSSNNNSKLPKQPIKPQITMSTAVCIVPPDDAWDTIQRARHLSRDTTFYKWPPAIRLFHPFAPRKEIPNLVGRLAEWIEEEMEEAFLREEMMGSEEDAIWFDVLESSKLNGDDDDDDTTIGIGQNSEEPTNLESFEVTLDSILILPHFEVLDARIEALEERMPQDTLGETLEERAYKKRKAEGQRLIEDEERKGLKRKLERDRKRRLRQRMREREENGGEETSHDRRESRTMESYNDREDDAKSKKEKNGKFNGPCVIYLSPNDESRARLESLREKLRVELFSDYDAFSPSTSVTPYPERLPRKTKKSASSSVGGVGSKFRPLLPIARFPTVDSAVKIAKVLQQTWDPLTFNVTDIQFVSRNDDTEIPFDDPASGRDRATASGVGFDKKYQAPSSSISDIPEVRHRRKHNTLQSSSSSPPKPKEDATGSHQRMALTSSGEVEDVSKQGIYGCDAMVMLWGEEPEEELMEEEASLSMIMDGNDEEGEVDGDENDESIDINDEGIVYVNAQDDTSSSPIIRTRINNDQLINGRINYDEIFTTAEREYQRMQAHEESPTAEYVGGLPIFDSSVTDVEAWLDDDDESTEDEGATVVIGRAQFFMGSMREFIGMPASSALDSKDRIMGSGVSAVARRRGSVHRLSESWNVGDYGKKDSDRRA